MSESVSELRDLLNTVGTLKKELFKLSIVLRNPTPFDRYAKAKSIGTYDTQFDIDYVRNKSPYLLRLGAEWLIERLGKANTRRREFLKYCEKHREKLAYVPLAPKPTHLTSNIAPSATTASAYAESNK